MLVVGALIGAAAFGAAPPAAHPEIFAGSLVLDDARPPTVIDLATAGITVRLDGVDAEVGADNYGAVQAVAVDGGTFLVNRATGAFNYLEADDYVADPAGSGVALGPLPGLVAAEGLAAGRHAFIIRSGPTSTVTLVDRSTVEVAGRGGPGQVHLPGFAALDGRLSLQAGQAAVAPDAGALWVLQPAPGGCRTVELMPGSRARHGLDAAVRQTLPMPCRAAALEGAGRSVALAGPGWVQVYGGGAPQRVSTPWTARADRFVPVTGAGPGTWFLYRDGSGWHAFGTGPSRRPDGPWPLPGMGRSSDPAPPALSGGVLYTLDRSQDGAPVLWAVDTHGGRAAPVAGAERYPQAPTENAGFDGAEVIADGPRVVFNNPQSLGAVVVFTDGTRPPATVDKSRAIDVSTTGPADVDVPSPTTVPDTGPAPARPMPVAQPVSGQVDCAATTQKPYAPQIVSATPGPQSVLLAWSYRLLDQIDCEPDSWTIHVTALGGARQPGQPTRSVTGQTQALIPGLRPATSYSVTVTADINRQSTASPPVSFTTPARGPDAPLTVTTTADGAGNWIVSWTPCTEAVDPACVVPADGWTVVGSSCGGGYVGTPPTVQVGGGQESVTISSEALGLLGSSLSFSVYGSLGTGLAGAPTPDRACTQAWARPQAALLALTAQAVASGGAVTAALQVTTGADPALALGAQPGQAEFVFAAGGSTVGPTNQARVMVTGLAPGRPFTPTVVVYPAGHPDAAVTVTGPTVTQTLPWPPDVAGAAAATGRVDPSDPNSGTLTVSFPPDLPSGPLVAVDPSGDAGTPPQIVCGSAAVPGLRPTPVQGGAVTFPGLDLVDYGGSCRIRASLVDTASPDPHGGPSPAFDQAVTIGRQPSYAFAARVTGDCTTAGVCGFGPATASPRSARPWEIEVDRSGGDAIGPGGDWTIVTATATSSTPVAADPCASQVSPGAPPSFPYRFDLPGTCPDASAVDVVVTYRYLGATTRDDAGHPSGGGAPATTTTSTPASTSTTTSTTTAAPCPTAPGAASTTSTSLCVVGAVASEPLPRRDPEIGPAIGWLLVALLAAGVAAPRYARRGDQP